MGSDEKSFGTYSQNSGYLWKWWQPKGGWPWPSWPTSQWFQMDSDGRSNGSKHLHVSRSAASIWSDWLRNVDRLVGACCYQTPLSGNEAEKSQCDYDHIIMESCLSNICRIEWIAGYFDHYLQLVVRSCSAPFQHPENRSTPQATVNDQSLLSSWHYPKLIQIVNSENEVKRLRQSFKATARNPRNRGAQGHPILICPTAIGLLPRRPAAPFVMGASPSAEARAKLLIKPAFGRLARRTLGGEPWSCSGAKKNLFNGWIERTHKHIRHINILGWSHPKIGVSWSFICWVANLSSFCAQMPPPWFGSSSTPHGGPDCRWPEPTCTETATWWGGKDHPLPGIPAKGDGFSAGEPGLVLALCCLVHV